MYQSAQAVFNPIQSISSASLTGSYQAFATFTYPLRILHIINNSTLIVTFSLDGGTSDHIVVPAGGFVLYDFGTNKGASAPALELPPTPILIKGTAGTGNIYAISVAANTPATTFFNAH